MLGTAMTNLDRPERRTQNSFSALYFARATLNNEFNNGETGGSVIASCSLQR